MISRGFSKYKPISRKKKLLKECLLRYLTRSLTSLYPISLSWSLAATFWSRYTYSIVTRGLNYVTEYYVFRCIPPYE